MGSEFDKGIDLYFVKIELAASYVLQIPAETEEEALRESYRMGIPLNSLFNVEKTAIINGPSFNEILKKAEARLASRRRKLRSSRANRPDR